LALGDDRLASEGAAWLEMVGGSTGVGATVSSVPGVGVACGLTEA
jgi:hypothetical protein